MNKKSTNVTYHILNLLDQVLPALPTFHFSWGQDYFAWQMVESRSTPNNVEPNSYQCQEKILLSQDIPVKKDN